MKVELLQKRLMENCESKILKNSKMLSLYMIKIEFNVF